MATRNEQGGWDISDAEAQEILEKSFGAEQPREQMFLVPYQESPEVSVWCVGINLQMFTNTSEDHAQRLASDVLDTHIFFFAELGVED